MKVLLCALEGLDGPPNGLNLLVRGTYGSLIDRHDVRLLAGAPIDRSRLAVAAAWLQAQLHRRPWQVAAATAALRPALVEELASFAPDVVHVVSGRLADLGIDLVGIPTVLTAIDAWHLNVEAAVHAAAGPKRLALRVEAANVRRFEATAFARFGRVAVLTERDRAALAAVAPHLPLAVVPHGVDAERFAPPPGATRRPATLVLHGVLSYPPNVTAARTLVEEVLPRVRASVPEVEVVLVGREPAPAVVALGRHPGVTVTGAVDDVRPWLAAATVYACPMTTGGGVKNKVLEAMACEAPCVVTSTAVEGLPVVAGRHALVEEDLDAFAAAVVGVLRDPRAALGLGRAGAELVRGHGWNEVGRAYDELYAAVVEERGARVA